MSFSSNNWIFFFFLPVLFGYRIANAQDDPDKIRLKKGRTIKATVKYDGYDKLVYKKGGRAEKTIPASQVAEVIYGGFPDSFSQGLAAEKKIEKGIGNPIELYETAAKSYELAANTERLRDPLVVL